MNTTMQSSSYFAEAFTFQQALSLEIASRRTDITDLQADALNAAAQAIKACLADYL